MCVITNISMGYDTLNDAARYGDIESVNKLLSQGKDINEGDSVSEFILVYLLTTTHSVSLLFYYRMVGLHLYGLPERVTKK